MYQYATVGSNDLETSKAFYDATLGAIGVTCFYKGDDAVAYAKTGTERPGLWVTKPFNEQPATFGNGAMLCFGAANAQEVNAFHAAALGNGGVDEGAPGYREHYSPDFYACYVRDPFGNKLCVVFRDPARATK
jgi:catechol 2,3-dioxygenase-like lactoylglutathione lyase family enzyme